MKVTARTTGLGLIQWERFSVERVPVPRIDSANRAIFVALVNRILSAKSDDHSADTTKWEREIDRLVYDLYGLTEEEIAAVEGRANL